MNTHSESEVGANPPPVWKGHNPRFFEGNIPITVNLATQNGALWASGNMGLDVHNIPRSARWLRPYRTEQFVQGSQHKLYWTIRGGTPSQSESFEFIAFKVDTRDGAFTPTSIKMSLKNVVCKIGEKDAKKFEGYGDECVFSQSMHVDPGLV